MLKNRRMEAKYSYNFFINGNEIISLGGVTVR
jgi:hypothetical protein